MRKLVLLIFLLGFNNLYSQIVDLQKGLVAFYPFNGNANDASGNGYHGTVFGATLTNDKDGYPNSAYSFNGSNAYIKIPDIALNDFSAYSFVFTFSLRDNKQETIISKQHNGVNSISILSIGYGANTQNNTSGSLYFHPKNENGTLPCNSTFVTEKYYNLIMTFSNSMLKVYIDGAIVFTHGGSFSIPNDLASSGTAIGAWLGHGGGKYFNGNIDEVRIYNRALNEDEIQALYEEISVVKPEDKIEITVYEKAITGSLLDCNTYITKYPKGKFIDEITRKKAEIIKIEERNKKIESNRNKFLWKLGNKVCLEHNGGIICGTINQWNEDKSMMQIKIVTSPGGSLDGDDLTKNNLIWVATSGKGWHLCLDDEIYASMDNDKSKVTTTTENEPMKYYVGDYVSCYKWSKGGGWEGKIVDKNISAKKYRVRLTSINVPGLWLGLQATDCSGNEFIKWDDTGKEIWVPAWCVE